MMRALILVLAGIAVSGEPYGVTWERKVSESLREHGEDILRIKRGEFTASDLPLIQLLAAYGHFHAVIQPAALAEADPRVDSLRAELRAAEERFYDRARQHRISIDRLAAGGKPQPGDSAIIQAMAVMARARINTSRSREIGAK